MDSVQKLVTVLLYHCLRLLDLIYILVSLYQILYVTLHWEVFYLTLRDLVMNKIFLHLVSTNPVLTI
jgi:hypothetical protein